jgi:GNAT superfamily N-acetyltransferase
MKNIRLRPATPDRDFETLAKWFTILEGQSNTKESLASYYENAMDRTVQMVAEDDLKRLVGFFWASHEQVNVENGFFNLYVTPENREQGIGRRLYAAMTQALEKFPLRTLRVRILDDSPEGREFVERRGFKMRSESLAMELNLADFHDVHYDELIAGLIDEGFVFTNMEELGNTEEMQRKLYQLNDSTSMDTPGSDGEHPWESFEDFQQSVCQAKWYIPAGQFVVVDRFNGDFAAMSAITKFEGSKAAYNLHTGVKKDFRGRKLGQAVKVVALRYARDVLKVKTVQTHHNVGNFPMLAIDRKLGYVKTASVYTYEKKMK